MAICSSTTVFQIFLDLKKAYDSVNRHRVLHLLAKYNIGPNLRRYIETVWKDQQYILRQKGFYSEPVNANRGLTQGDTDSPILFNIIVDAVLRTWKEGEKYNGSRGYFYVDDGLIEHHDPQLLQQDLDAIISLFQHIGLQANEIKTKYDNL